MLPAFRYLVFLCLLLGAARIASQNEFKKWYFGTNAALDFMTSPPTTLTNSAMSAGEGCASIANAAGSLLFYTDGGTVYDQTHSTMANGSGLFGTVSPAQAAIILKQPGTTNIYYIFTISGYGVSPSLCYSIVDMSLSSGNGSVTVKNSVVYNGSCCEMLSATRHCNGTDYWIVCHEMGSNNFRSYLFGAAGVNTTAVVSSIGFVPSVLNEVLSCIKISQDGKKLGMTAYTGSVTLFDYNNSTGAVSNSLSLSTSFSSYGCEFSPDCTKFYAGCFGYGALCQWDLCAGSGTAIIASQYSVSTGGIWSMQLAPDGKIYCAKTSTLGVINSPNLAGSSCNYVDLGQSISPKSTIRSIPNIIYYGSRPPVPPFTKTVSCQTATFVAPNLSSTVTSLGCSPSTFSVTGYLWNFGDPASASTNTSGLQSPVHAFSALGVYTVQLIIYYACGTDTLRQTVSANQACITVTPQSITCASLGSATVTAVSGIGPYSYTWMPSGQTGSVANNLGPGTYTLTVFDLGNNFTYTATSVITSSIPLLGNLNHQDSVRCYGASTATANITNITGGSGAVNYVWFNGSITYTTPTPSLAAGSWTVTLTDALTFCQFQQAFSVLQPPQINLLLSSGSPTLCAGQSTSLSGQASGGMPFTSGSAYQYSWTAGPLTATRMVSQATAGLITYTLNAMDSYGCSSSNTIGINFTPNPSLLVSGASICPMQSGVLIASGASSYSWSNGATGSQISDNPLSNQQYTVIGTALGCTSTATAAIILKPVPIAMMSSNSPQCQSGTLQLNAFGGASYQWTGPNGFTSSLQYPLINPVSVNDAGVFSVTVTALNGCTAMASGTVAVYPQPSLSVQNATICINQPLTLSANSSASNFTWTGPGGFFSTLQNPSIPSPSLSSAGNYTVKVMTQQGCVNSGMANISIIAMPNPTLSSNSPLCAGSVLNLSASGGGNGSYLWTGPAGYSSSLQNPSINSVTPANAGIYNLQVTAGPCVVNLSQSITVNSLPTFTPTSNSPVCAQHDLKLNASAIPNATFTWKGPGAYQSQNAQSTRYFCDSSFAGVYTLSVTDLNGCKNLATHTVIINKNPVLVTSSATVCLNQPVMLSVTGALTYTWTGPGIYQVNQANVHITQATSAAPVIYSVVGTAANQCTSSATASLSTLSLPQASINIYPNNKVCLNKEVSMEGYDGTVYSWYGPSNNNYKGKRIDFRVDAISFVGNYTLVVSDENGCQSSTVTSLQIDNLPNGYLSGTQFKGCIPFCSDFRFVTSGHNVVSNWTIDKDEFKQGKFSRCFTMPGTYTISGFLRDTITTCNNTLSVLVEAYQKPTADFELSPQSPAEEEEAYFTNTSTGNEQSSWSWFIKTDTWIDSIQKQNFFYAFHNSGTYPVALLVKNKWGCSDTAVKIITIEPDLTLYVPNAFTPNDDDRNEIFLPVIRGVKSYKLMVFDRWGEKLFETANPEQGWDGTYKGEPCKMDVYAWKIYYSALNGTMKTVTGSVLIEK